MYCYQCQETAKNSGCTIKGVCGKTEEVANMQDLLVYVCKGLSYVTIEARKQGIKTREESKFIVSSLFITITNANFDNDSIIDAIKKGIKYRDILKLKIKTNIDHDSVQWNGSINSDFKQKVSQIGVLSTDSNEDLRSLKQYVTYGIKGMAAYAEHAFNLGFEQDDIFNFIEESLVMTTKPQDLNTLFDWVM
jgi:hydroxylamine reductase